MYKILFGILMISQMAFGDYISNWDGLLRDYTKKGSKEGIQTVLVDYKKIGKDDRFESIIDELKRTDPTSYRGSEKKAFWINVYNIAAVKLVSENKGIKSIKDIATVFSPVWGVDAINVGGKIYSLGFIEHKILRKTGDPLIHYGIVCASLSCPDLRQRAYRSSNLKNELKEQEKLFLENKSKGMVSKDDGLYISNIFKWYKKDFGDIHKYLNQPKGVDIKYLNYNWNLNSY